MRNSKAIATLIGGVGLAILLVDTLLTEGGEPATLAIGLLLFAITLAIVGSQDKPA